MTGWVEETEHLQSKRIIRVRTPEGARKYGQAIGTVVRTGKDRVPGVDARGGTGILATPAQGNKKPPRTLPNARRGTAPRLKPKRPTVESQAPAKTDRRTTQGQTPGKFVHPVTGHMMSKTEVGDTFEQLFQAKMKSSLEDKFGCCLKLITGAGEGTARNTPLDFSLGKRGGEVKTLNARAANQKTAIKREEVARKVLACRNLNKDPLLIVQVVDQDSGEVRVYGHPAFESKAVARMTFLGSYAFTARDFQAAQERSGHWDKAQARAAAEQATTQTKAVGDPYDPPDEEGGVIEPGDTVVELGEDDEGRIVPFIYTAAEGEEDEEEGPEIEVDESGVDEETKAAVLARVRTPAGARRYDQPIGTLIRPARPGTPAAPRPSHRTRPARIDPREFDQFLDTIDQRLTRRWRAEGPDFGDDFWAWVVSLDPEDRAAITEMTVRFLKLLERSGKGWLIALEGKSAVRRVRTPAGARRYGQPIGTPIRPDIHPDIPSRRRRPSAVDASGALLRDDPDAAPSYLNQFEAYEALGEGLPHDYGNLTDHRNRSFAKRQVVDRLYRRLNDEDRAVLADLGAAAILRVKQRELPARSAWPIPFHHNTLWSNPNWDESERENLPLGEQPWEMDIVATDDQGKNTGRARSITHALERGWSMRRGDDPVVREAMARAAISDFIHTWASTSNDQNPRSLAVQEAARQEFGLDTVHEWEIDPEEWGPIMMPKLEDERASIPLYRRLLRAQYEETQDWLRDHGIAEITLHRGMAWGPDDPVPAWRFADGTDGAEDEGPPLSVEGDGIRMRPLSSWTANRQEAQAFASRGDNGVMLSSVFPARLILSTPRTGFGCLNEYEFVVLAPANGTFRAAEF